MKGYHDNATLTFVHAGELVLEDGELVDVAELLEHGPQVLLGQVARDLAHEELDGPVHGGLGARRRVAAGLRRALQLVRGRRWNRHLPSFV